MSRTSNYDPKYCEIVVTEMNEGASIAEVSRTIGISRMTFGEYRKKHKEFEEAVTQGVELSLGWWMEQGRIHIKDKTFNTALYYINMKNRHHWNDQKVSYPRKVIKGYEGAINTKMGAIDKALAIGVLSTDEHHMLMDTLLAETKILEKDEWEDRISRIENAVKGALSS